jgi:hypothetical protein
MKRIIIVIAGCLFLAPLDDELGLRRAGRLRAPAPIWSMSTGTIWATTDRTSPH